MSLLIHTVLPSEEGRTVRQLLTERFAVSSSLRRELFRRQGAILLSGRPVFLSTPVCTGDVLTVDVSDPPGCSGVVPVDFPLTVLWEDEHLLAVDKPAGITVHGAALRRRPSPWRGPPPTIWAAPPSMWSTVWTGAPAA